MWRYHEFETFPPSLSHEVDFMNIHKVFEDPESWIITWSLPYRPDQLALFVSEIRTETLKFESVKEVKFHFLQIPAGTSKFPILTAATTDSAGSFEYAEESMKKTRKNSSEITSMKIKVYRLIPFSVYFPRGDCLSAEKTNRSLTAKKKPARPRRQKIITTKQLPWKGTKSNPKELQSQSSPSLRPEQIDGFRLQCSDWLNFLKARWIFSPIKRIP